MAGDIVNLRQARKRKVRAEREQEAERNRFEHGRSRAERDLASRLNRKATADHDAGRRETDGKTGDASATPPSALRSHRPPSSDG